MIADASGTHGRAKRSKQAPIADSYRRAKQAETQNGIERTQSDDGVYSRLS